jgi:serine/threonine protein kinase/Flp pilus assembly protein TadD
MLVEHAGSVVTREEIQNKLWPNNTVVEFDHSINAAIKKLRIALNDSAENPRYVETVARRGYRFIAPVEWPSTSSSAANPSNTGVRQGDAGAAAQPQLESEVLIGRVLAHYRVLNIIGGGGMGVVYRAEDLKLGRAVALKFIPDELNSTPIALVRFEREARTASALNHPNICTIHEIEEHDGRPFLVMEFLEGQTLRGLIELNELASPEEQATNPPLTQDKVLDLAIQITNGLDAAHQKGIVHRDIKPANIFVTREGQAKILDFGLAKLITEKRETDGEGLLVAGQEAPTEPAEPNRADLDANLTRAGASIGTAGYMSPEQLHGNKLDARTDLFCFGLVLYEMLSGQKAFSGHNPEALRHAILYDTPTPVRQLNPAIPPRLEQIIGKCLQKDRQERYQHASEIRTDLEQLRSGVSRGLPGQQAIVERPAGLESAGRPGTGQVGTQRKWLAWVSVSVLLMAVVGFGLWYWQAQRPKPLTNKDTVIVADFINSTRDPVFDDALKMALGIQLEQSPFLNVLSDSKVRETLRLMNRPADQRLTPEVAREVCLRTGTQALLQGSIAAVGKNYLIGLKAIDCHNGNTLASAEAEAENQDGVLKAVDKVGNELRGKLGESLGSVAKFNTPLEEATTSSLEALQAFTRGMQVRPRENIAIPYFERAVELDPNFARAYAALGAAYFNLEEHDAAVRNLKKAYELRSRVSERERLEIEGAYYGLVTGELQKTVETYKGWLQSYPNSYQPYADLGFYDVRLGNYDEAASALEQGSRLAPSLGPSVNSNLLLVYAVQGRLAEAQAIYDRAQPQDRDDPSQIENRYVLAFLQGDQNAMQEQLTRAMGKAGLEDHILSIQADTETYHGQIAKARDSANRAAESARRAGSNESAASWKAIEALREAELGNSLQARKKAGEALSLNSSQQVETLSALALARSGDVSQAQTLADKLNQQYPLDTTIQYYWLPSIAAAIALEQHAPERALSLLQPALNYELGWQPPFELGPMYPAYVRGLAYLQAKQAQAAAAEFQKMLAHPGVTGNFVLGALARLQLARAQVMMGDKVAAQQSYRTFLELWKNADPDLAMLQQAKSEYAAVGLAS